MCKVLFLSYCKLLLWSVPARAVRDKQEEDWKKSNLLLHIVLSLAVAMAKHTCNREDCPPISVDGPKIKCSKCKKTSFVHCFGGDKKSNDFFKFDLRNGASIHVELQNLQFACSTCTSEGYVAAKQKPKTPSGQTIITDFASSTNKTDELLVILNDIKSTVESTNNIVSANKEESKTFASVLADIKETTNKACVSFNNNKQVPLFSAIASKEHSLSQSSFPALSTRTPKRQRIEKSNDTPKVIQRNRRLVAGTNKTESHGLGSPIKTARFDKSIYLSRLQPSVSSEKVIQYMKTKLPELNENDISLRLLVKKDRPLNDLTFISYRLLCTEQNYALFMDSSFWPEHVMIGEFIEKKRDSAIRTAVFTTPMVTIQRNHMETDAITTVEMGSASVIEENTANVGFQSTA